MSKPSDIVVIKATLDQALVGLRRLTDPQLPMADVERHAATGLRHVYRALASSADYAGFMEARDAAAGEVRAVLALLQGAHALDPATAEELSVVAGVLRSLMGAALDPLAEPVSLPRAGAAPRRFLPASVDEPVLLDPAREILLPAIPLPDRPAPEPPPPAPPLPPPAITTFEELEALMAETEAAGEAAEQKPAAPPVEPAPAPAPTEEELILAVFGRALTEEEVVFDRARSSMEDLAALGRMRRTSLDEPWTSGRTSERRLLRKVDAIVACGEAVLPRLVKMLEERPVPDPELTWANLYLQGSLAGDDALDGVVRLARIADVSDPEMRIAVADALALLPQPHIANELRAWLRDPLPARRAAAVTALARRRAITAAEAADASADPDTEVVLAAAAALGVTAGSLPDVVLRPLLGHADERVARAAIATAFRRRSPVGREACVRLLAEGRSAFADAACFVAIGGGPDAWGLLESAAASARSPTTLRALGWSGHLGGVPILLDALAGGDEAAAAAAVEALQRLTGATLTETDPAPEYDKDELPFVRGYRAPLVVPLLAKPEPWDAWWRRWGGRAKAGVRYRFGHPWSVRDDGWELACEQSPNRDRELAHLELVCRAGLGVPLDLEDFVVRQVHQVERMQGILASRADSGDWPVRL